MIVCAAPGSGTDCRSDQRMPFLPGNCPNPWPRNALHASPRCDDEPDRMCSAQPSWPAQVPEPLLTQATPQANWAAASQIRTWLGRGRVSWRGERGVVTSLFPASNSSCINGHRLRSVIDGVDGIGSCPPSAHQRVAIAQSIAMGLPIHVWRAQGTPGSSIPSKAFETDDIPVAACPPPTRPAPSRHQHRQPTS